MRRNQVIFCCQIEKKNYLEGVCVWLLPPFFDIIFICKCTQLRFKHNLDMGIME